MLNQTSPKSRKLAEYLKTRFYFILFKKELRLLRHKDIRSRKLLRNLLRHKVTETS